MAENAHNEREGAIKAAEINREKDAEKARLSKLEAVSRSKRIDSIMLTTETAPNLNITKRIEIVTAECAFGMNMFKDLFAGVRDIVGGRSEAVQKTMRDSRKTALYELKVEASLVGANAVVGVDLDYVELSGAGSMIMLVASGTAVIIED
ncbi:YbjQ family protein [Sulfitobacter sp.]|uniref:YbjQ family protein n=1 Tax=Sulfitobacter sp. TaxID=1903071 RepID=UPI003FCD4B70